jgi:DNA-directed RNA polymerase specialized sigma subunit
LAIALCKAAQNYDASRGVTFASMAYHYMWTDFLRNERVNHYQKRDPANIAFSLDAPMNNEVEYSAVFGYDADFSTSEVAELLEQFEPREKAVLQLWLEKAPAETVQKTIGHGRCTIYHIRRGMKQKALAYMEG